MIKLFNKINIMVIILMVYMLIFQICNIINTDIDNTTLAYSIDSVTNKINDETSLNEYVYSNVNQIPNEITIISYPYVYSNDEAIITKFKEKITSDKGILLNSKTYYVNGYDTEYMYDGNIYTIDDIYQYTIIPMKYLEKSKILELKNFTVYGNEGSIKKMFEKLDQEGFNINYSKTSLLGGYYDVTPIGFIINYVEVNIMLILSLILSSYILYINNNKKNMKLNYILLLHGISVKKSYYIYIKDILDSIVFSFLGFVILLFILNFLEERYIFLSGISLKLLPLSMIILILVLYILIFPLLKVKKYISWGKYE